MLTRKDYESLAAMIAADHAPCSLTPNWTDEHIKLLADWLQGTNPKFDRVRFIAACRSDGVK